jgi:ankyrin repeat protein
MNWIATILLRAPLERDANRRDDCRSALLRSVLASDHTAMQSAIEAGNDLNAWDDNGMTPLLYAVFRGDLKAVDAARRRSRSEPCPPR